MGYKSRPAFSTGGHCIRECVNKDKKCAECFKFDKWELPEVVTLSTMETWSYEREDVAAYQRAIYLVKTRDRWDKVRRDDILEVLRDGQEKA